METCIFQGAFISREWEFSQLLERSGERCYLRGGADTCTLRGEDCRYCGAFHAISENFVLDD
jgi:hypothetical protein